MPLSASPGEQSACAIQLRLLQDFSNAIATPDKSLWRTSMLAAFGSARTHGLRQELCAPRVTFLCYLRASVVHHRRAQSACTPASVGRVIGQQKAAPGLNAFANGLDGRRRSVLPQTQSVNVIRVDAHRRRNFRPAFIPLLGLANDGPTPGPWRVPTHGARSFLSREAAGAVDVPGRTADRRWAFAQSRLADALARR
jgi:hypothetical protein